jgi:hypothetical protein
MSELVVVQEPYELKVESAEGQHRYRLVKFTTRDFSSSQCVITGCMLNQEANGCLWITQC